MRFYEMFFKQLKGNGYKFHLSVFFDFLFCVKTALIGHVTLINSWLPLSFGFAAAGPTTERA